MRKLLYICLFFFLSTQIATLAIEGEWTLQSIGSTPINKIGVTISKYIYRQSQIINRVLFQTCNPVYYQVNVIENNFYVNIDTEYLPENQTCSKQQASILNKIRSNIRSVLKFQILVDSLIFLDPSEEILFNFTRKSNSSVNISSSSISGSWVINYAADSQTTYVLSATNNQLSIGGATFSYVITPLYAISIKLISAGTSKDKIILTNTLNIAYYRTFKGKIEFYDANINLMVDGFVNPSATPTLLTAPVISSTTAAPAKKSNVGFQQGKYLLLLLLRRDLIRVKTTITSNQITFKICSQLTFNYTLLANNKIQIQPNSVASLNCKMADESIFIGYLSASKSYTLDSDGSITLQNENGKDIVVLTGQ